MADIEVGALAASVSAFRKLPKSITVSEAIEANTGYKVLPVGVTEYEKEMLRKVCNAADILVHESQIHPIETLRVNELGNAVEEPLLAACKEAGLNAVWPKRKDGSSVRNGYPDIQIDLDLGNIAYLEAKVIQKGSERSSFRSFYMSPSERPKVSQDAYHLLIAFVHDRQPDGEAGQQRYKLSSYKLVDLSKVSEKIKFEYQASNKDMYVGAQVIASGPG